MANNFFSDYPVAGGSGVTSINGETGAITLTSADGSVTITEPSAHTIDLSVLGGPAATSIGPFGSTPNANGLSLSAGVLNMQPADGTHPGGVSILAQTFAGNKTFLGQVLLEDGTNSLPGLAFSTEANTGLYRIGALDIGIAVGGVRGFEMMNIGSSLINIGLGTGVNSAASAASNAPFNIDRPLNAQVFYNFSNSSSGTSSSCVINNVSGSASATWENWNSDTINTYLGGNTIFSSGQFNPGLILIAESTSSPFIAFVGGGRTLAKEFGRWTSAGLSHNGSTSGAVTVATQAAAGTWNFNLPITAGSAGQVLTSQAGGSTAMTWTTPTTGTVTSIALSVPATSIFGVSGSPVTSSGTLGLTTTGTSGGIPYFSSTSALSSSGLLTASQLVLGGGAGSAPTSLAAGSQYQVLVMGASNPGYGAVNLAQSAAVTGVLPNSNTTAASANTASAIVTRDGSGNFIAGTITAALTGTASGNTTYTANNHGVVLSSTTNAMTVLAPNASTVFPLVSGGASADPSWTGLTVPGGGTGVTSATAYAVLCGGTTSTAALQSVSGVGTTGQVLTSNGASALPTWQASASSPKAATVQQFQSTGTGTGWLFTVTGWTGTIVSGDTYTNNGHTYTALQASQTNGASGQTLFMSGSSTPTASGTLTKSVSASGPATISFSANISTATYTLPSGPAPLYLKVTVVGGGAGGGSSGTGGLNNGASGGVSAFGANVLYSNGGSGGTSGASSGGNGGSATITGTSPLIAVSGGSGGGGDVNNAVAIAAWGGNGGNSTFGGSGGSSGANTAGMAAAANSGSGGGGAGSSVTVSNASGAGGGAGGSCISIITSPASSYTYLVGSGGAGGSAGTGGSAGGSGAAGIIIVEEYYQ